MTRALQEASGLPFWDDVQGFDFSLVGREIQAEAVSSRVARVLQVGAGALVTQSVEFKSFDITTMAASDLEFTAEFELRPLQTGALAAVSCALVITRADASRRRLSGGSSCAGLVVWFDTAFSARFCVTSPITLTTSPHAPPTHWAQTLFDFKA